MSSLGALPKALGAQGLPAGAQQVFQMAGVGLVFPVPPRSFSRGWKAGLQGEISAEEVKTCMQHASAISHKLPHKWEQI